MLRSVALGRVQHREIESRVALLFPNRRQDADAAILDRNSDSFGFSLAVADLDLMQPADLCLVHLGGDGMLAVASQPVDAAPDEEMRAEFMGGAEKLIDVALAIADMDTSRGIAEQRVRLAHVLQPAEALLLFDGHPRRIDFLLERSGSLELRPRPELDRRKAKRQPLERNGQARMHQEPAHRAHRATAVLILATVERMHDADLLGPLSLIGELGRVLQNQDGTLCCCEAAARRQEVTGKDLLLADALIGKEAIGCLGISPVLAGQRNARTHGALHSLHELAEPFAQTLIRKPTTGKLTTKPCVCRSVHGTVLRDSVPDKESRAIHAEQELWVIESRRRGRPPF